MITNLEERPIDTKEVRLVNEALDSNEIPWPSNYPGYLFSGTSLSNSRKIEEQGFAKGTFTADPIFAIAGRFYRGSFMIAKYDDKAFKPLRLGFTDFVIDHGSNPKTEQVVFDSVGTGMLSQSGVVERLPVTKLENVLSVELTREQRNFIGSISMFFGTSTMNFYSNYSPAEDKILQTLGIDFSKVSNRRELQELINTNWKTEAQFADMLITHFPGEIKIQWQNGDIIVQDVLREMINQIYLIQIMKNTKTLIESSEETRRLNVINYFPEGVGVEYIKSISDLSLDDFCNLKEVDEARQHPDDLFAQPNDGVDLSSLPLPSKIIDPNKLDF